MDWLPPPNLPTLQHDETLYSWCGFVHACNGTVDVRNTCRGLFGSPFGGLLHDLPSRLGYLQSAAQDQLGPAGDLAVRHTLLGYFLTAWPTAEALRLRQRVVDGACPDIKFRLGVAASRVGGAHPLKSCSACMAEDEQLCGRAYWHVDHQLPSVFVCLRHSNLLSVVRDSVSPVHRRAWMLPRAAAAMTEPIAAGLPSTAPQRLLRLAHHSVNWAAQVPGALNPARLALTYQAEFRSRGWLTDGGNLRLKDITAAVRTHYRGLEALPGLGVLNSVSADWPGLVGALARKVPRPGHPLKHLLLITMLFDRWEDFLTRYAGVSLVASHPPPPAESGAKDGRSELLAEFERLMRGGPTSVSAAAKAVGVSTTTGVRWATLLGLTFTPRTKSLTDDLLAKARALLQEGHAKPDVCAATGISAVSLNRLISSEPVVAQAWRQARFDTERITKRRLFIDLRDGHIRWSLKQLRSLPNNGYAWLRRHDPEWLAGQLPGLFQRAAEDELD